MKYAVVADDNTGATDAAGMLTEKGVRTALFIDIPERDYLMRVARQYDAAAIGAGSRSIEPQRAYRLTAEAVGLLKEVGAEKIQIKYCSTFDSTPRGNIGPSLDAALDTLELPATIVSAALPVNGRTTYCGYHFVDGQLLCESPLKDHPLNPMSDANLVRWLQLQTRRKVALAALPVIRRGAEQLAAELRRCVDGGDAYIVTDAVEQGDLAIIARATADWPLTSGSSGITAEMPDILFPAREKLSFHERLGDYNRGVLVIAGSCSPATRRQNAHAVEHGFAELAVDAVDVLAERIDAGRLAEKAASECRRGNSVLLCASADPEQVSKAQRHGREMGMTVEQTGERIASFLAETGSLLVESGKIGRVVVSGGESSAAVCRRFGVRALEVGLPIEPGVPYCFPLEGPKVIMVLKSGNFGSRDFYIKVKKLGI